MISSIKGVLESISDTEISVNVNGIGYEVFVPLSTFEKLPREGGAVHLFIHTLVKEDAIQLFGFATRIEKKIFRLLMSQVSGVGPRLALNILGAVSPETLFSAVSNGDAKALGRISGVGKKTAERIVLELKNKMKDADFLALTASSGPSGADASAKGCEEAILALANLGFKFDMASKIVRELARELGEAELSTENLIRKSLERLNA